MVTYTDNKQAIISKELIVAALFTLMETDSYRDITITQICQEARVSRQTFYRNFEYRRDILDYYFTDRFQKFQKEFPDTGDGAENTRLLIHHFPFPKKHLHLIREQGIFHILEENMWDAITESRETFQFLGMSGQSKYQPYVDHFIASTIASALITWIDRDFQETEEELIDICTHMLLIQ